jgi:ATP synthase protein I
MFFAPSTERPPTMTTETPQVRPAPSAKVLLSAARWSVGVAVVVVIAAVLLGGGDAAVGALVGAVTTLVVLSLGTWVVLRVAAVSPMASLLAALVVFTAQGGLLLVMLAVVSTVTDGRQIDGAALAVIAVTVAWTTLFLLRARKERIPLFDLSATPSGEAASPHDAPRAGVR